MDTCFTMPVVDVLCDEDLQVAAATGAGAGRLDRGASRPPVPLPGGAGQRGCARGRPAVARARALARPSLILQPRQYLVRFVRPRLSEVVVEDLTEDRPGPVRVGEEVVQLEHARVVGIPQAAWAAERRDAALHRDARAGEGGEVSEGADEDGGFHDAVMDIVHRRCGSMGKTGGQNVKVVS